MFQRPASSAIPAYKRPKLATYPKDPRNAHIQALEKKVDDLSLKVQAAEVHQKQVDALAIDVSLMQPKVAQLARLDRKVDAAVSGTEGLTQSQSQISASL